MAPEINGMEMEPKGNNPFPLEIPSQAKLRLYASLDTFKSRVTYEVAIRTASGGVYVKAVMIP